MLKYRGEIGGLQNAKKHPFLKPEAATKTGAYIVRAREEKAVKKYFEKKLKLGIDNTELVCYHTGKQGVRRSATLPVKGG
jgi:hypothetical protein